MTLRIFWLAMLFANLAIQQPEPLSAQSKIQTTNESYVLLNKLADDALGVDNVGRKRLSIENQTLSYNFRPEAYTALVSRPDRLTVPLEVLIRSKALTRDFRTLLPTEAFWIKPLDHIQMLTARIVESASDAVPDDEWNLKLRAYQGETTADFNSLETGLFEYATLSKLNVVNTRGASDGYSVEIHITPPKARVRFVPFLDYLRSQYFHKSLEDEWNDLNEGTNILIGRYHYRAEWPASLNGPEEGNFDVHGKATITFRPKEK